ncbi:MAG: hypothetical protein JF887_00775 [Candidatus Dormibacteraeota bacterium]|uniref:4-diphosphocytidyl-2-C-methyl-D-erythritol kinase n=1 Tax=Candidatus Amunia macphersoniae TaxID=3127014 RepID=A0A934KJP0_9BACT|nr:hypothetical protein [Candidatus Dormibacteraeota bacterium]
MLITPAYAKVNLCLAVRGRRGDGFHELDSVAVSLDWHDLVGISIRPAHDTVVRLHVSDSGAGGVPAGSDNLAARAAAAVAALIGPMDAEIWLEKRLPRLAGLGGGSADAAAVLSGCATLLAAGGLGSDRRLDLDHQTLSALAASLGSDVPMTLVGGAQRMGGRGERLTALAASPLHLAVALAGFSDTAATFAATTPSDYEQDSGRVERVVAALRGNQLPADHDLGSGLEAPACRASAELAKGLGSLRASLPESRWHLTGSGGAVFALAGGEAEAADIAARARAAGYAARACRTIAEAR